MVWQKFGLLVLSVFAFGKAPCELAVVVLSPHGGKCDRSSFYLACCAKCGARLGTDNPGKQVLFNLDTCN